MGPKEEMVQGPGARRTLHSQRWGRGTVKGVGEVPESPAPFSAPPQWASVRNGLTPPLQRETILTQLLPAGLSPPRVPQAASAH